MSMGPYETGVIYEFRKHDEDTIHVETCGPVDYIIYVENTHGHKCMAGISRKDAEDLCRALLIHIEKMKIMWGDCE